MTGAEREHLAAVEAQLARMADGIDRLSLALLAAVTLNQDPQMPRLSFLAAVPDPPEGGEGSAAERDGDGLAVLVAQAGAIARRVAALEDALRVHAGAIREHDRVAAWETVIRRVPDARRVPASRRLRAVEGRCAR